MRILYVSHTALIGGAERSLLDLLGALPGDVEPHVLMPHGPLAERIAALGVPHAFLPQIDGGARIGPRTTTTVLARLAAGARATRRAAAQWHPDVVHGNLVRAGLVALLSRPAPRPVVVSVRDLAPDNAAWTAARRVVGRRAALIIANSRGASEAFATPGMRAAMTVINPPVDVERFAGGPPRDAAREALGLPRDRPLVGVAGILAPHKAQDEAIEALHLLRDAHPSLELVLAGEAKFTSKTTTLDTRGFEQRLRDLVDRHGLAGRVHFTGEVDATALYPALDVLLAPGWAESWGRTVVEAMAAGTPVIAADTGGPRESVEHGRSGLLVEPRNPTALASAIRRVLEDPGLAEELREGGRARARRWSLPAHVEQTLDAYRSVLGRAA